MVNRILMAAQQVEERNRLTNDEWVPARVTDRVKNSVIFNSGSLSTVNESEMTDGRDRRYANGLARLLIGETWKTKTKK